MRDSVQRGGCVRWCWAAAMVGLTIGSAAAQEVEPVSAVAKAEANRLREDMATLVKKNAWRGVNAKYEALVALGIPLSPGDHHTGAEAARNLGAVLEQRERLAAAGTAGDESVWLRVREIDETYGRVYLLGSGAFGVDIMPFDPDPRRAIERASQRLDTQSSFYGLLPTGGYRFGGYPLQVESEVRPMLVTHAGPTLLRDPYAPITPQGDTHLWNEVALDWTQARAVMLTQPESAAVLQGSSRERFVGFALVGAGVASIVAAPFSCEKSSVCRPLLSTGGVLAMGASVPLFVRSATEKRRAVQAWNRAWASHD